MLSSICIFLQMWHVYSGKLLAGITVTLNTHNAPDPYKLDFFMIYSNSSLREKKLFGGEIAPVGSFPFQVAVVRPKDDINAVMIGTGSILSPNYILTSTSCVQRSGGANILALLGAIDWHKKEVGQIRIYIKSYTYHKDVTHKNEVNNIAVARLVVPIQYTDTIQPVVLPTPGDAQNLHVDAEVTLLGWGQVADSTMPVRDLRFAKVRVIPNSQCGKRCYGWPIDIKNICTIGAGFCLGDFTGNPMMYNNTQIGIHSFFCKYRCSDPRPTVFTRVTKYLDWIEFNTRIKKDKKSASKKKKKGKRRTNRKSLKK